MRWAGWPSSAFLWAAALVRTPLLSCPSNESTAHTAVTADGDEDEPDEETDCGDDDEEWFDDDKGSESDCGHSCAYYADHWTRRTAVQALILRQNVVQHLTSHLKLAP